MDNCKLEVWNSALNKSEWVDGEIIGYVNGGVDENFDRIDVKTANGMFYGCHPDCVKIN